MPELTANTPDSCYRMQMIQCHHCQTPLSPRHRFVEIAHTAGPYDQYKWNLCDRCGDQLIRHIQYTVNHYDDPCE